jgi:hypothetical protein
MMISDSATAFTILMPVYDDWEALDLLLERLDLVLCDQMMLARVLIVDDGSTCEPLVDLSVRRYHALEAVHVLRLRRNLGHQRAIAVGLAYLEQHDPPDVLVIMDCDGEDDPADVPRLVKQCGVEENSKIIFAERTRRSESWQFRFFYWLYKSAHVVLTGRSIRFGNFSALPRPALESLVVVSELWNHYAAAVLKARLPYVTVPTRRARRLSGRSRMNFIGLVTHGLGALSVESETIGVRMLVASLVLFGCLVLALLATVAIRLGTGLAIPGWATTVAGLLLILLAQTLMLTVLFSFITLAGRLGMQFLPCRDCAFFVSQVYQLGSKHE